MNGVYQKILSKPSRQPLTTIVLAKRNVYMSSLQRIDKEKMLHHRLHLYQCNLIDTAVVQNLYSC